MLQPSSRSFFQEKAAGIFKAAKNKKIELTLIERAGFLTRFSESAVHQNGCRRLLRFSVRLIGKGRAVRVDFSEREAEHFPDLLRSAERLLNEKDPSDRELPLLKKTAYRPVKDFDPEITGEEPEAFVPELKKRFRETRAAGVQASGYHSAAARTVYFAHSEGLEAFHVSSAFRVGFTLRKKERIGYASGFSPFKRELRTIEVLKKALGRIHISPKIIKLKPGPYQVLLAPRAAAEFLAPLFEEMNARKANDGDSFFSGKKGKRLFSGNFSVEDNVYHSSQTGLPFDGEGSPRQKVCLIDEGRVLNFVSDRKAANDLRLSATGHAAGGLQSSTQPMNVVIAPGKQRLLESLGRLEEVLLIPHIWYHQLVHPGQFLATGLAKGNALLFRRGECVGAVGRARYLQAIPEALVRLAAVSLETETIKDKEFGASVLPYLLFDNFRII